MAQNTPFHTGEQYIQSQAGVIFEAERSGNMIKNQVPPVAWEYLSSLQSILIGIHDHAPGIWPSIIFGSQGFLSTQDGKQLSIDLDRCSPDRRDITWKSLVYGARIGILAIDLETRRRLRINGTLIPSPDASYKNELIKVKVEQAFFNCPKYIQRRSMRLIADIGEKGAFTGYEKTGEYLDTRQRASIASADTSFVASVELQHGVDLSHRGGNPGFIKVVTPTLLRIPDYRGNNLFNTLGNIQATGLAGLLVIDFSNGTVLQIAGKAEIKNILANDNHPRYWLLHIERVRETALSTNVQWQYLDASPYNPPLDIG